ncbi:MAG: hypothetical protein J5965_10295 [Aeriscardovia sp.]|nr:hypothetical protein [Aeriscardovia sp.]
MTSYALTTVDNPYHPIDEYDDWFAFDMEHGYRTQERLAKVTPVEYYWTDLEQQRTINAVIDDFVRLMPDLYKKVEL